MTASRNTRITTVVLGLAFLGTAFALLAFHETPPSRQPASTSPEVRVDEVSAATTRMSIRYPGVTRARNRAVLSFPMAARLVGPRVEIGDHLQAGQAAARLDDRGPHHALQAARAALAEATVRLDQAQRNRARTERLVASKAATPEELENLSAGADAIQAARDAAAAQVAEAERAFSETTLRVPFAGTVTAVFVQPGEIVGAGTPVLEISGDGAVELRVEVPESGLADLQEGSSVAVELPFAGRGTLEGRIRSLARTATGPGRLFPVLVDLAPAPGLRAGLTAELVVERRQDEALTVPLKAVLDPGSSRPGVFVVREGRARHVPVSIGAIAGERIAVRGALATGERVIVAGHTRLSDGDPVEVRR